MKKNQNGFSVVEVFLVTLVIGLLGLVGWLVLSKQQEKRLSTTNKQNDISKTESTEKQSSNPYANWKTASFNLIEASFKYPESLKMTHELKPDASSNTGFETYTLEASDNTKITLTAFHFMGGFTGDEPKYLIEDVVSSDNESNSRNFSSIIYKNSSGEYDAAYIVDSSQTKYKAGEEKQIFLNAFSVKPKGSNNKPSKLGISVSGQKNQTFKTLDEIKSMGAFKDVQLFLNSLEAPSPL